LASEPVQVILISGLSGSGKSLALKVLEDAGYYCVDNLPAKFVPDIIAFLRGTDYRKIALTIDVRSGESLQSLPQVLDILKEQRLDVRVLFLEANSESLVKRFSETRRPHPLSSDNQTLQDCIDVERARLEDIAETAHRIDTSGLSPNTLRAWVRDFIHLDQSRLTLFFESFGFKNGIPLDADFVFDVRCLPNPFYDPELRPLTGLDRPVTAFLDGLPAAQAMLADIQAFIARWLPEFARDNRSSLTIALGCTGGLHRSVYLAEKLAGEFAGSQQVLVRHRELVD
jgi:RNase adapter protein RapZ